VFRSSDNESSVQVTTEEEEIRLVKYPFSFSVLYCATPEASTRYMARFICCSM
jgi:hypothetical protein